LRSVIISGKTKLLLSPGKAEIMTKPKVMLVDDAADFHLLFRAALRHTGVEVLTYSSASEAMDYVNGTQEVPVMAFVDLRMPGMSGEEFIKKVRSDIRLDKLKVILTSGWQNLRSIAKKVGANGFLIKPFDLDELEGLVLQELLSA
jgi:two-component system alkaline phosphatase synthesis response regulator PhoP